MAYGKTGKLAVELSVIGLMLGTSMAFFAVINELGANLVQVVSGSSATPWQRALLLVMITTLGVLPLSLQRNMSNSMLWLLISLIFYTPFVFMLLARCLDTVSSGRLATPQIRLWHWSGITTCLPIFGSMFICQPQVLPMYFSLKERSVERMELAFKQAITISCTFYTIVGLCGYIPLPQTVPGNILATLPSTTAIDYVRLMFLFSMVMSFPLVVLPCRQAINTLLFEQQREDGTFSVSGDMPRQRHVIVTVLVVFSTMTVGALVQDGMITDVSPSKIYNQFTLQYVLCRFC
uniref:Putative sodium-coupled neutral amino acid transporter 10 n=1 Tax=Callorhinchus milii TaxID=7868 RepID=A0A4W3JTW5_CALMI